MLKVGRLADYGILILHHLGRVQPARLSMESISELTHVPLPTVRKVMRFLAEAGLVISKRGPNGGYQIARPPAAINLAEAIAAVEGTTALTDCCGEAPDCELMARCDLAGRWPGVNRIIMRVLERTSLADLDRFGETRTHIPPPLRDLLRST
ncbi:MAG TPA: SUF system Fe-S cluster assembly regulator [Pseudomonadales bacterium]|nr:SUF system Fe-S cluster assembly regulator [Pseudomonadales bacterium]